MKKAFIFDLFGTLVEVYEKSKYYSTVEKMGDSLGMDYEDFHRYWNIETYNERMCGVYSNNAENIRHIGEKCGLSFSEGQVEEAVEIRRAFVKESLGLCREGLFETLENIKGRGYKIGLISDCSPDVPELWGELPYVKYFDDVIFSCRVGLKKPDREIYKLSVERLGVEFDNCYYIGDGGSNELTGAMSVGMHPVLIKSVEDEQKKVYKKYLDNWSDERIFSLLELKKYK